MTEPPPNPYRSDRTAGELFVGRAALLSDLQGAFLSGRLAIRAVMGGRGMGKTSLAEQLETRTQGKMLCIRTDGQPEDILRQLGKGLGAPLDPDDLPQTLAKACEDCQEGRALIIIDEIEKVLHAPNGRAFLDNLGKAYEQTQALGILVLGGIDLRHLLEDEASPFLRKAGRLQILHGLTLEETRQLLELPTGLTVPEDTLSSLWSDSCGHPLLIQAYMEQAVDLSASEPDAVFHHLAMAASMVREARMNDLIFPLWWRNLDARGQQAYQQLIRQTTPVTRPHWVATFGADPKPWVDALISTGVATLQNDALLARGTAFRDWVITNHPLAPQTSARSTKSLDTRLAEVRASDFESTVVRTLATWARTLVEYPSIAIRADGSLQLESFFQLAALQSLLQHENLRAEAEALSRGGRSDIKVRAAEDPARRA